MVYKSVIHAVVVGHSSVLCTTLYIKMAEDLHQSCTQSIRFHCVENLQIQHT